MKICVGILGNQSSGLDLLLRQIGVPFEFAGNQITPEHYSVVIAGDVAAHSAIGPLQQYLKEGGTILCSGSTFAALAGKQSSKKFIRWFAEDQRDNTFPGIGFVDVCMECVVPDGATCLWTNEGAPSAVNENVGNGYVIALPFDVTALLSDERVMTKSFYAKRSRLPFETVSLVSRSGIRSIVTRGLEILHHKRGIPFLHQWNYPESNKNIFLFRIDTDYADLDDLESLVSLLNNHNIRATWFVDVKNQENILSFFKRIQNEGQEIGVHCYEHLTFDGYEQNSQNIRKAKQRLEEAGIHTRGFAAPFGKWNRQLSRAISEHGFEYSSEFSYDYDNLPGYPPSGEGHHPQLQVPVHPVSIGSLRRQGFSQDEMIAYFENVSRNKLNRCEPLFFYHHPKNYHHEVLERLFSFLNQQQINNMTMLEFAQWWKQRDAIQVKASFEGGKFHLADAQSGNTRLFISRDDDTEAVADSETVVDLGKVSWKNKQPPVPLPADIRRIRKFNPWIAVNRIEDYIHSIITRKA